MHFHPRSSWRSEEISHERPDRCQIPGRNLWSCSKGHSGMGLHMTPHVKFLISIWISLMFCYFYIFVFLKPQNIIWTCYMTRTLHGLSQSISSVFTTQQWPWLCRNDPYFHVIAFTNQSSLLPPLLNHPPAPPPPPPTWHTRPPAVSSIVSHHSSLNHSHSNQCGRVPGKHACKKMNDKIVSLGPNIKNKDLSWHQRLEPLILVWRVKENLQEINCQLQLEGGKKDFLQVKKRRQKCLSISIVTPSLALCSLAPTMPASEMVVLTTFYLSKQ